MQDPNTPVTGQVTTTVADESAGNAIDKARQAAEESKSAPATTESKAPDPKPSNGNGQAKESKAKQPSAKRDPWQNLPMLPKGGKVDKLPSRGKALEVCNAFTTKAGCTIERHAKLYGEYAKPGSGLEGWCQRHANWRRNEGKDEYQPQVRMDGKGNAVAYRIVEPTS